MTSLLKTVLLILIIAAITSCKKEHANQPVPTQPASLVRSIKWDNGTINYYKYNPDSTLKEIEEAFENTKSFTRFTFTNRKLTELTVDGSARKVSYLYNDKGQVEKTLNSPDDPTIQSTVSMEYTYDDAGKVSLLNHYLINQFGKSLKGTTSYEYKSNGDLYKVKCMRGTSSFIYIIDSYSAECNFPIYSYLDISIDIDYPLYNYPILNTMKKLPKKIIYSIQTQGHEPEIESITNIDFTITAKRLDKTTNHISYPGFPTMDETFTRDFKY